MHESWRLAEGARWERAYEKGEGKYRMAFTVQHLDAWYGRKQALFDINLSIEPQTVTAMIGPSGCGKSTFVRCLNRMHEEVPDARVKGTVLVDGFDIYARSIKPRHVREHVGMVFQQPNVLPTRSIFDNVAMGPRINGTAHGSALKELVESSLRQAAMWDEVKDKLDAPATESLRRTAAATLHRAGSSEQAADPPDG